MVYGSQYVFQTRLQSSSMRPNPSATDKALTADMVSAVTLSQHQENTPFSHNCVLCRRVEKNALPPPAHCQPSERAESGGGNGRVDRPKPEMGNRDQKDHRQGHGTMPIPANHAAQAARG